MSTFGSIYSVRSGLNAARRALDVVGQNVANANTHGYTRQEVSHIAAEPANVIKSAGRGIADTLVLRYRDEFLDRQFRSKAGLQGFYDSLSTQLGQVEQIVGDLSTDGLRTALDEFFNAWDTLSSRPSDSAARAQVVTAAEQFLDTAQAAFTDLAGVRTTVDEMIRGKVDQVNAAARQIAVLNQEIMRQEVGGRQPANELRDERDRLVDSLAKLAGTTTVTHSDGAVTVHLGSMPLVDRHMAFTVDATVAMEPDRDADPTLTSYQQNLTTLTWAGTTNPAPFQSGEVAGLLKVRDQVVPQYMKYVDTLVRKVADEVNRLHKDSVPAAAQVDIFTGTLTPALGTKWMDVIINPAVKANPGLIRASTDTTAAPPAGDGGRALLIARMRTDFKLTGDPVGSLQVNPGEYLRAISSHLGIDVQQAQRQAEAAAMQVDQAEKQRQSVSGVSLDDEMTKMIQFQQTYNAAARMMTTLDEMLDVVVNRIGLVGR